jgi:hypothetical protein
MTSTSNQPTDQKSYPDEPEYPSLQPDPSAAWITEPDLPYLPPDAICVRTAESRAHPGHLARVWLDPASAQPLMLVVEFPPAGGRHEPRPWAINGQYVQTALRTARALVGASPNAQTDAEIAASALEIYTRDGDAPSRPRGGSPLFSRLIAGVYRLAMADNQGGAGRGVYAPAPVTKIALLWEVSRASSQNWIEEARRDGFLGSYLEERRFALGYPPEDPSPYARAQRERTAPAVQQEPTPAPEPPEVLTEDEKWAKEVEQQCFKHLADWGLVGLAIKAGKMNADDSTDADYARVASSLSGLELSPKWLQVTSDALRVHHETQGGLYPERSSLTLEFLLQRHSEGGNLYGRPPTEGDPPSLAAVAAQAPPIGEWLAAHGLYDPPASQDEPVAGEQEPGGAQEHPTAEEAGESL